jgi:hypothetical protein
MRQPGNAPETAASLARLAEHRRAQLVQLRLDRLAVRLPVTFGVRLDAQRPQQLRRGSPGIACLAQDRVQTLVSEVMKDQVDDAPRVVALAGSGRAGGSNSVRW